MDITIKRTVGMAFDDAVQKVTQTLQGEGFGILTTIDIQEKMKEKLGRDMDRYLILGACNPPLAWDALHAVPDIGVLLPCNVCVWEQDGNVTVAGMEPLAALSLVDDETVAGVAKDASARLRRAIESV